MKIFKKIINILMIIQIVIGVIFIAKNANYMPKYGDTAEFLEIAKTMELDTYRPFVYPLMLNISTKISGLLKIKVTYIIYLIQMTINMLACFILINTLNKILKIGLNKKQITLYSLFVFSIPLNLHFNMSVKCDSLAISFTIMFLCYFIRYLKEEKYRYAIYTLITMFISSNIRSEKIYFLSFVLICALILEGIIYLVKKQINWKKIIVITAILILGIILTKIAQIIFQDENANDRSQPTVSMYLYERIVEDTLPEIYEYLPENIKLQISYEDALYSASNRNYYKVPYETLFKANGNLDDVNTIMKVAVRRNFPDIITSIISDFTKNLFSPYYLVLDNEDESMIYTKDRMEGEHYLFADAYLLYFNMTFIVINTYLVINIFINGIKITKYKEMIVMLSYSIVNAGFFALLTSQNFHIRYTMPVYVIEIAIIVMLFSKKTEVLKERK